MTRTPRHRSETIPTSRPPFWRRARGGAERRRAPIDTALPDRGPAEAARRRE